MKFGCCYVILSLVGVSSAINFPEEWEAWKSVKLLSIGLKIAFGRADYVDSICQTPNS